MKKVISIIFFPSVSILYYYLYQEGIRIPCLFYVVTGYYCPGCGMGRAVNALFNGQLYQAFQYNVLGLFLLPFILFYLQYQLLCWGFQWEDHITKHISKHITYFLIGVTLVFGVMRNLDTFSWLAPIG